MAADAGQQPPSVRVARVSLAGGLGHFERIVHTTFGVKLSRVLELVHVGDTLAGACMRCDSFVLSTA